MARSPESAASIDTNTLRSIFYYDQLGAILTEVGESGYAVFLNESETHEVLISQARTRGEAKFLHAPKSMNLPVISLRNSPYTGTSFVRTPYKDFPRLPRNIISNGSLFRFETVFLFGKDGQARRHNTITNVSLDHPDLSLTEIILNYGLYGVIDEVDFPINEEDCSLTKLSNTDLEIIDLIMQDLRNPQRFRPY